MHQNKISLKYLTAVALQHLNAMTWPVVTERETLFLSSLQVSVLSVRHPHGVHHRSPALNWVDLHRMKCFTCKNNNNPTCSVVRFSCQKKKQQDSNTYILQGLLRHSWRWRTLEFQDRAVGIKMFPYVLSYAAVIGPEEDTVWKIV